MKILFLANLVPYPADNGGKIKTLTDLKILSSRHNIDLLCFYEHEDIEKSKNFLVNYCENIDFVPIRVTTRENMILMLIKAGFSLFSPLPLCISKYKSSKMKKLIEKKLYSNKYDAVYLNILAMFAYSKLIKKIQPNAKIILAEQNCEALIYKRFLEKKNSFLKNLFLKIEYSKLKRFEKKSLINADKVILLSDADKNALEEMNNVKFNSKIVPIGTENYSFVERIKKDRLSILFVGTLTWEPNNDGLIWFLDNVIPNIKISFEMYIVGKNPSEMVKNLSSKYKNIHVLGYVESVDMYFDKADCMVVPLFVGSGQRVKIIESFGRGLPVISTSIGAEGLGYTNGKDILIANNKEEFVDAISSLTSIEWCKSISQNARELFLSQFEMNSVSKKLLSVVEGE